MEPSIGTVAFIQLEVVGENDSGVTHIHNA